VRFHGAVDDVLPYYAGARVVVVPLRIGSGVRVKIIQAMAMRRAIVSTSKGCEGLDVEDGRHLVVADDPDAFAAATARLLDAPAERARLGEEAHRLASARHDAMADHPPFVALCEELAAGCTGRRT
jgi:glycosyltransferase involved in cell wall biosynthesis